MPDKLTQSTAYGLCIIESLRAGDDSDGKIIHKILEMSNIVTLYYNAKTFEEFKQFIGEFKTSNFRYLHLSCHADKDGLEIGGEEITNETLAGMLAGGMNNKRLFMSAYE